MTFIRKIDIDSENIQGNSIFLTCEYFGCNSNAGMDYKRLPEEKSPGWEDEPIYLCDQHSQGHEPVLKCRPVNSLKWSFQLGDEPELIHVIKTGFANKYMVVHEDAYEHMLGKVDFHTKEEVESKYGISIL